MIELHLSLEVGRTGRPAQVLRAMDLDVDGVEIERTVVEMDDDAPVARSERDRKSAGDAR